MKAAGKGTVRVAEDTVVAALEGELNQEEQLVEKGSGMVKAVFNGRDGKVAGSEIIEGMWLGVLSSFLRGVGGGRRLFTAPGKLRGASCGYVFSGSGQSQWYVVGTWLIYVCRCLCTRIEA